MNFEQLFGVEQGEVFGNSVPHSSRQAAVALAFLSKHLPSALISEQLAKSLCSETGASVVLVRMKPCDVRSSFGGGFDDNATVVDWASSDMVLQGQFRTCSLFRTEAGFHILTLSVRTGPTSPEWIASLLGPLKRHFQYVLVEAPADDAVAGLLLEFLKRSDQAYLFLEAASEDIANLDRVMQDIVASGPVNTNRFKPVLCLPEGVKGAAFETVVRSATAPVERFVHDSPRFSFLKEPIAQESLTGRFRADLRRLAREISGRLVGVALSSGAAKGFAHIGVIQVLEENGIEVDVVAGASIGAYIGALWTYGHDGTKLEALARELESRWGFWGLLDPVFPPRQGFLRGFALRKRLMRSIGDAHFADLARPLRVVAGNLATLDRTVFATGEVAPIVHASMAVPGICVPVMIDGEAYIDGGIVDPVPVDLLRDMGAARVIAVNTIPAPDRLRHGGARRNGQPAVERNTPLPGRVRKLFRKVLPLDKQLNYFAPGNLFEIVVRSVHGAQARLADASCRLADLVLHPDVSDDRWLDCRNPGRFITLGREVAERNLEQIKALVETKKINHETEFTPRALAAVA